MNKLLLVNLVVVVVVAASVCDAAERPEVVESSETIFLPDAIEPGLAWLRQYGSYHVNLKRIENADLKQYFAKVMSGQLERYILDEWIPINKYVLDNIQLLSADVFEPPYRRQDMVFLRYRVKDLNFLASYSRDTNDDAARFILLIRQSPDVSKDFTVNMDMFAKKGPNMIGQFWVSWQNGGAAIINRAQVAFYKKPRPGYVPAPCKLFEFIEQHLNEKRETQIQAKEEREKCLADPKGYIKRMLDQIPKPDESTLVKDKQALLRYEVIKLQSLRYGSIENLCENLCKEIEKTKPNSPEYEKLIGNIDNLIGDLQRFVVAAVATQEPVDADSPVKSTENDANHEVQEEKEKK
jgi:hypothetical protein